MSVYTFYNLIDYMLLFSVHCVLLSSLLWSAPRPPVPLVSDAVINVVVMTPVAANELAGTRECVESRR